ncbi:hypothetical protein [Ancylobacter polymorphus]|uniref:DUF2312 domain-containing protein n=1 Tax=Ancylobacter polymorphus TaxID=223390 RepID=A0ABU0B7R3_9HYPH|nr:hypothetical protein [Ancylobacter polymorphus]MDQ0301406.1 hypothetical protein [Ancylobacter polymorphus]
MAKKAKPNTGSVDRETIAEFEKRYQTLVDEMASMKGSYMSDCKSVRGEMKDLLVEAKDRGVALKPFKARLKVVTLRKKIDEIRDALEAEDAKLFDYYDGEEPAAKKAPGKRAAAEQAADTEALSDFEAGTYQ